MPYLIRSIHFNHFAVGETEGTNREVDQVDKTDQKYACRQTGKKGKNDNLKDLPESTVDFLIRFVLDAFGLPTQNFYTASEYERNPNRWWLNLAENNEEGRRIYDDLPEARMKWIGLTRIMGRALTDVRAYHLDADRGTLLESKKKRIMTSTVSTDLNVIEKTESTDIAVEEMDVNDTF